MNLSNKQVMTPVKKPLTTKTALLLATMIAGMPTIAQAEPTGYDQISFTSEVKSEIANDEVQATMSKKVQAKDAKKLAVELNTAMNSAMQVAKKYPSVTVTTGQNSTYPSYNDNGKINGWNGQASINIKSTDLESTSQLIAELQEDLVLGNLSFAVSEAKQDEIEKQMLADASKQFQQQAQTLTTAWGASSYRVINVQLNTGSNYYAPVMARGYAMSASAEAVPNQDFESGNSTITVSANGTIELVR